MPAVLHCLLLLLIAVIHLAESSKSPAKMHFNLCLNLIGYAFRSNERSDSFIWCYYKQLTFESSDKIL